VCTETNFSGGIVWCYSEKSAIPTRHLQKLKHQISHHKSVPNQQFFENARGKPTLVILDDLLYTAYSEHVSDQFTRGSHHRNISVFLITQNLFHKAHHGSDISLNAKYIVALKNLRDKVQFAYLARQVYPEDSRGLYEAYLDATKDPHGYIVLDLTQDSDDLLRFRTKIFPDEHPPIVYAPAQDVSRRKA
jgi:hypothetical protein